MVAGGAVEDEHGRSPTVEDVAREADGVARRLASLTEAVPAVRHQGMPSDGDHRPVYEALGSAGLIGVHWPTRAGGRGLTPFHTLAAEERFGYHWLPLSSYLLSVKTIGNALLQFDPGLAERFLPEIAAGRLVFCQGFSEPEAGSDLAALRTSARLAGGRLIVNGRKIWTSSVEDADWIYLAVRTEAGSARHRGISVLVVEKNAPGIEWSVHDTVGGGVLGEVALADVAVPLDQVVGPLGEGWRVLMGTLDYERVTSEKVGTALSVLDQLDTLASPAWRSRLRSLRGAAAAAREHGRRATELLAAGEPAGPAASMAKLSVATLLQRIAGAAVEMLGPRGLVEDGPEAVAGGRLARMARAVSASTIAGGASDIQRRVIALRGLGCPR